MLPLLQRLEQTLIRSEERLLALLVIVMLSLAVYNVVYRNVLVPIQTRIVLGDKYDEEATPAPEQPKPEAKKAAAPDESDDSEDGEGFGGGFGDESEDDDSGGFGGGFGDDEAEAESESEDDTGGFGGDFDEPKPAAAEKPESVDDSGGFGGDFDEKPANTEKAEPADESGGFGGDFDDADDKPAPAKPKSDDAAGFGGDFEDEADSDPAEDGSAGFGGDFEDDSDSDSEGFGGDFEGDSEPTGAVEESMAEVAIEDEDKLEGFPAFVSNTIDALKLEWIDVLLRQLVLFVGLLGGMLATQRRKHITVDALSMLMPKKVLPYIEVLTATLSLVVCVLLAISGWNLVLISLEYPKELMEWADEWHFQLVFPIGFGLLAFHFLVRVVESTAEALWGPSNEEAA